MTGLSVGFLMPAKTGAPTISPALGATLGLLQKQGVKTELIVPEENVWELSHIAVEHDLYVLVSASPMAISVAGVLTINGAEVLNSFARVNLCMDRIASTAVLSSFGVPVPPSYATGKAHLLSPLLGEAPLLVEARRGIWNLEKDTAADLESKGYTSDNYGLPIPLFARKKSSSETRLDLKVNVVGNNVWTAGIRGGAMPDQYMETKIGNAALACGKALSLEVYNVDFELENGFFEIVRVNPFPGYGITEKAAPALSDYIILRGLGVGKRAGS